MIDNADMPANPVLHTIDGNWVKKPLDEYKGLTKREHFAGLAMAAIATKTMTDMESPNKQAEAAVMMADALLKELEK